MRAAGIVALLVAGCTPAPTVMERSEAEQFVGVPLPRTARDVRILAERGIDQLVQLRFDAPEDQARQFATRVLGHPPAIDPGPSTPEFDGLGAPPANAIGGSRDDEACNRHYRLKLARSKPGSATIWLIAFET